MLTRCKSEMNISALDEQTSSFTSCDTTIGGVSHEVSGSLTDAINAAPMCYCGCSGAAKCSFCTNTSVNSSGSVCSIKASTPLQESTSAPPPKKKKTCTSAPTTLLPDST